MNITIPPDFRWSFSKQNAYETCPLSFRLQYLEGVPQTNNAFAEYGTLCHELQEEWAKGKLAAAELADAYASRYNTAVTRPFPPFPRDMPKRYFDAGLGYFKTFDGFGAENEILSVEDKFTLQVEGHAFAGIADLILRSKTDGAITVVDHKSKSMSSMKKDMAAHRKQLYVYAAHVREAYGEYPALLRFNMFRDGIFIDEPFDRQTFEDTKRWIADTIDLILLEDEWRVSCSSYFCQFICGVRHHCPVGEEIIYGHRSK